MKWLITSIWKEQIIMTLTREQRWFAILPITEGWKDLQASIKHIISLRLASSNGTLLSAIKAIGLWIDTSLLHNTQ